MKRSISLSAFLVAMSTASLALAAPPAASAKGSKKVAQAQPDPTPAPSGDPQPAPPPADPAPATAPAAPAAPEPAPVTAPEGPAQPAVVLGTGPTIGGDTSQNAATETKDKKKERPWANSNIYAVTSMTTATIFKGQMQYNDPTVDSSIWLLPRYNINDSFQLRGRLIFSYEYTNSDTTTTQNEPRFSDTTLQLFYKKIPEIATIKPMVALNVSLPTSPESRARTLDFSPGATFQLSKTFEHVAKGDIQLVAAALYSHPIYQSVEPDVRGDRPYAFQCAGGGNCQDALSGTLNPSDIIAYTFTASATWGKWTPGIFYLGSSQWVYHPKDSATVPVAGGQQATITDQQGFERSAIRQAGYLTGTLDYDFTAYLTGEVGYSIYRNFLTEGGQYGNPFFDQYQDMRVYLGVNFNVDAFAEKITGKDDKSESGIIRAQNGRTPVFHY